MSSYKLNFPPDFPQTSRSSEVSTSKLREGFGMPMMLYEGNSLERFISTPALFILHKGILQSIVDTNF
jgi:hypothetical protein